MYLGKAAVLCPAVPMGKSVPLREVRTRETCVRVLRYGNDNPRGATQPKALPSLAMSTQLRSLLTSVTGVNGGSSVTMVPRPIHLNGIEDPCSCLPR